MLKNNKHPSLLFLLGLLFFLNTNACSPTGGIQPTISSLSYTLPPTQTPVPPSLTISPPIPSETMSPLTSIEILTPLSSCNNLDPDGKILVLGDGVLFFFPSLPEEELDEALAEHYPEWANYKQNVRWGSEPAKIGKIVKEASFQDGFVLNPAVTLVTLGESLNWEIPPEEDLFEQSLIIGERLVQLWYEWDNPRNEEIRMRYPEISNGATYALYVFFDYDKEKLQVWCDTYVRVYDVSPLKTFDQ